ncbi:single-stranded DNA-binding protein [Pseudonocardia bannensis]|uniref:Single-stranded DNA-binding protein n=1 Tax=Pseudonocardia bannensis TaxID=630973 RepID=A0A848DS88_9PSEU|nr:single-stranded DNA-binding protein [Pseudonocardia bannensis]NMH95385.1 single-stranded DNA-binding protein [Pseudonocardia bannensis]
MNEIYATVVGNIVGDIRRRRLADGTELAGFRMASNERRYDKSSGTWVAGETSYVSVTCWRRLGQNVAASFVKGDPVMVYGRLYTREYAKDGQNRTDLSLEAYAVGPDLTWCTAALTRSRRDAALRPEMDGEGSSVDADLGTVVVEGEDGGPDILGDDSDLHPHDASADEAHLVGGLPDGRA